MVGGGSKKVSDDQEIEQSEPSHALETKMGNKYNFK